MPKPITPTPPKNLYDTPAAAKFLDLEPETLARWRLIRRGPRFVKIGKNVRYRPSDLEAFLDQQTVQTSMRGTAHVKK